MINNKRSNAPLILFCYNRLESLKKVISSLRSDYQIQDTDVYIFSDGPKIDSSLDVSKVKEVRKYLYSIEKFSKSINIFEHDKNQGLANSIIYGINKVSANNETFISYLVSVCSLYLCKSLNSPLTPRKIRYSPKKVIQKSSRRLRGFVYFQSSKTSNQLGC